MRRHRGSTSTHPSIDLERSDLTALLLRARSGDADAESAFIRRTMPDVARFCAHMVGESAADDALQATYLRALRSLRSFRGESSAKTWLLGVARNTCLDELRRRGRHQRLQERIEAQPEVVPADHQPLDAEHLADAVRALGAERREAFVLTQVLGYSYEEAAAVAGCPTGTIRSRVARARADLQVLVSPVGTGEDGETPVVRALLG